MRTARLLLAAALLPACTLGDRALTGECPDGEVCSDKTPNGLEFVGVAMAGDLFVDGPGPTAIGGTQEVAIQAGGVSLTIPFAAVGGSSVEVVDTTPGAVVETRGAAVGGNYLRIVDPVDGTLFDRRMMTAGAIDHVGAVPTSAFELSNVSEFAFFVGERDIGFGLFDGDGGRLVDTSAAIDLAEGTRTAWDTMHVTASAPTTLTAQVTAGGVARGAVPVAFVDSLDDIAITTQPATVTLGNTSLCFEGLNQGRHVVAVPGFAVSGDGVVSGDSGLLGCVGFTTSALGPLTLHVNSLGFEKDLEVTVVAQDARVGRKAPAVRGLGGERAELAE